MKKLFYTSLLLAGIAGGTAPTLVHAESGKSSTVGQYVDDSAVTAKVKARFAEDQQVSALRINVETLKGTVQLSGFAATEAEKARAAQLARGVAGVTDVRNDIVVRGSASAGATSSGKTAEGSGSTSSAGSSGSGTTAAGSASKPASKY
ncbi:MAG: BON domain-containing protein [Betaproteobacteria bacterium]